MLRMFGINMRQDSHEHLELCKVCCIRAQWSTNIDLYVDFNIQKRLPVEFFEEKYCLLHNAPYGAGLSFKKKMVYAAPHMGDRVSSCESATTGHV